MVSRTLKNLPPVFGSFYHKPMLLLSKFVVPQEGFEPPTPSLRMIAGFTKRDVIVSIDKVPVWPSPAFARTPFFDEHSHGSESNIGAWQKPPPPDGTEVNPPPKASPLARQVRANGPRMRNSPRRP
jgi:hypothetical protein